MVLQILNTYPDILDDKSGPILEYIKTDVGNIPIIQPLYETISEPDTTCCDMGQNDTIGKIELKIIFRLAVGISNSRNDIQLFLQLFDELRVNGDYH